MRGFTATIGRTAIFTVQSAGRLGIFTGHMLGAMFTSLPRRKVLARLMYLIGVKSIPVVGATGAFVAMVMAVQMYQQLHKMNAEGASGAIINIIMVKELGPLLAAVMLAGRVGGAMAAELGTMKVTEQIDALRTLGTDPIQYLVVPRFLACFFLIPVLAIFSVFLGVVAGYVICVKALGIDSFAYLDQTRRIMENWDIFVGIIKSFAFGGLIAVICCYKGFTCGEGAEGVGRATTEAFVFSFIAILVADFHLSVLLRFIYNIYLI